MCYNNCKHLQLGDVVEHFKNLLETMPQLQLNNDVTKMKYVNKVLKFLSVFTTTTKPDQMFLGRFIIFTFECNISETENTKTTMTH